MMYKKRILAEFKEFYEDNTIDKIKIYPDETNMMHVDILFMGNENTPYECGFYWFKFIYPDSYPFDPPKMEFKTTDGNRIRFNPNLYEGGKVCLSILNTWGDNNWSAINTITKVLISIQSIVMHDKPLINEPGYENSDETKIKLYSRCVKYNTLQMAIKFVNGETGAPEKMVQEAKKHFNKKRMIELCMSEDPTPVRYNLIHQRNVIVDFGKLLNVIKQFNL